MLSAFSAHITGGGFSPEGVPAELPALTEKALLHKILPMVMDSALPLFSDEKNLRAAKILTACVVAEQSAKNYEFLKIYSALRQKGIAPLCVKGVVCAALYPEPDFRSCSDADLLLSENDFSACCAYLTDCGFKLADGSEESFEAGFRSESGFKIEIHRLLFSPDSRFFSGFNAHFENAFAAPAKVVFFGEDILTLPPTQNMLYLALHAFKHFAAAGVGIRQICDMALFAEKYGGEIDWSALFFACSEFHADCFLNAVLITAQRFFAPEIEKYFTLIPGFDFKLDISHFLQDIMGGAVYGAADRNRLHSANITLSRLEEENSGHAAAVLRSVFPPAKTLEDRYPYLKKHRFLLPVAWASRTLKFLHAPASSKEILEIGKKREDILREYKVIFKNLR